MMSDHNIAEILYVRRTNMLKSERLLFKQVDENDLEWLRETRNKYKDHFFDSHDITKEQQKAWYNKYRDIGADTMFIVKLKSGEQIGTIAIYDIDVTTRNAKLGRILLLTEFRKHGYAEEMVERILKLGFEEMRLYKIKVECYWENLDAIVIYHRAGFTVNPKPIMQLEAINQNMDWKKPLIITGS